MNATVTGIATKIHAEKAYSLLPMLHDALLEDGCSDEALLTFCRCDGGRYPNALDIQRQMCMVLGGEYKTAVEWMENFAICLDKDNYGDGAQPDFGFVIEAAEKSLGDGWGDITVQYGGQDWQEAMYGENRESFWRNYDLIQATEVPEDKRTNFFSCSC